MDSPIRVTSTDEDELVDIEGDTDDIIKTNDIIPNTPSTEAPKRPPVSQINPFKQRKRAKTLQKKYLPRDNEFTKWWKSASEFQRPVVSIAKRETTLKSSEAKKTELDPLLQSHISSEGNSSTHFVEDGERFYDDTGEVFHPPDEEVFLPLGSVDEKERELFPEFFSGRTKYSPHNYVTIRDAILKLWLERKPEHVNKVMMRPILKKCCGNVNNIGKIHRYLESIGAINFGSDSVWWKRKKRKIPTYQPPKTALDTDFKLKRALEQRMSGRNRKRPSLFTSDLSSSNLVGGYTIDHANNNAVIINDKKDLQTKPPTTKKYNLVRCREFKSEECPYEVIIDTGTLVVMDVHSHLSTNEVMGLMGGYVTNVDSGKVKVHITCAQPCKSSASSRHCEMDPVSQSSSCDLITSKGTKVVGWYHSHPTFPPQPSETDIATQVEQQRLFSAHGSLFLGSILTPYYKHQIKTEVNLVHVGHEGIPFSVPFEINVLPPGEDTSKDMITTLKEIIDNSVLEAGKGSSRLLHLMDPIVQGSTITHLDKLMKSLSAFVMSDNQVSTSHERVTDTSEEADLDNEIPNVGSTYNIMTSSLHSDDDASDSYSIDQNFPSLADNGFYAQDGQLRHDDVIEIPYVDDVIELPQSSEGDDSPQVDFAWMNVFDNLKSLLLRASEGILSK